MMDLETFTTTVARTVRHQRLLARAGLNAVGQSARYPIDISELRSLSSEARGTLMEFLSWVARQPKSFADAIDLCRLQALADYGLGT